MTAGDKARMADIVRYWHAIELFDPQAIPAVLSRRELADREPGGWCVEPVPFLAGEPVPRMPWQEGHPRYGELPKESTYGSEWRHVVYGGVFSFAAVGQVLAEKFGFTEQEDYAGTRHDDAQSALFAFTVDQRGLLLDGTGAFSSCAWASGRLDGVKRGQRSALDGFDKVAGECQAAMERLLAKPVTYPRSLPDRRPGSGAAGEGKDGDGWLGALAGVLGGAAEGIVSAVLAAFSPALRALGAGTLSGAVSAAITQARQASRRDAPAGGTPGPSPAGAPPQAPGERGEQQTPGEPADGGGPSPADDGRPVEALDIAWFGAVIAGILQLPPALRNYLNVRVVSYPVERRRDGSLPDPEPVFLSSMIAPDLKRIADAAGHGYGTALTSYLSAPLPLSQRIDLRDHGVRRQLLDNVAPVRCPPGRWPADPARALVLSQQLAVNAIVAQFGAVGGSGLFAVNGPPGTGKTTLLRDLVAAIVVARARELAKLRRPGHAFVRRASMTGKNNATQWVLGPRDELSGFEILVASSNNSAVENVTREIPARRALGEPWQDTADYFAGLATDLLRARQRQQPEDQEPDQGGQEPAGARPPDEAWGLVGVPLGNSKNRKRFCGWFWRGQTGLRAHLESLRASGAGQASWEAAKERFDTALKKADALAPQRAAPDAADWDYLDQSDQENAELWPDGEWLTARAEVFLAALDLHRALVATQPEVFQANLELLAKTLAREPDAPPGNAEYAAWQTLFLLIPVVSTTFASCGRLLGNLGRESLGWALIDEAGQALPQAAVGALWRAKRAVVVGDPRQLEPISRVPAEFQRELTASFGVSDELWRPGGSSAQALADRRTALGTWVPADDGPVWVGAPLRVHRRCEPPMFAMSNDLAYGGMMVYGTHWQRFPAEPLDQFPRSCWVNVRRQDGTGKWVPAQGEAVLGVLAKLWSPRFGVQLDQVYVLSPFRDVAAGCRKAVSARLREEGVPDKARGAFARDHVGTVHSMQGREADVVILVLGADRSRSGRASRWVGSPPNLLNVAVSRARRRLFVIGCFADWAGVPGFGVFNDPDNFPVREFW